MWVCNYCGQENTTEKNSCPKCSMEKLDKLHLCPSCSTQNHLKRIDCRKCGTPLSKQTTVTIFNVREGDGVDVHYDEVTNKVSLPKKTG